MTPEPTMPNSYSTARLLRQIAHEADQLAPEVEAPRDYLDRHNTEYPTHVTRLMMAVGLLGMFAIVIHDLDRRFNPQPPVATEDRIAAALDRIPAHLPAAPVKPPRRTAWEECRHLRLTWTPYTYTDCKTYSAQGKRLAHREGM